ncbi:MAG TPA: hypothetical protein VGR19_01810, partial [Allosphingosinicella sp.]|nr:hypothetical protein [Allosphingosinicella sp.]
PATAALPLGRLAGTFGSLALEKNPLDKWNGFDRLARSIAPADMKSRSLASTDPNHRASGECEEARGNRKMVFDLARPQAGHELIGSSLGVTGRGMTA